MKTLARLLVLSSLACPFLSRISVRSLIPQMEARYCFHTKARNTLRALHLNGSRQIWSLKAPVCIARYALHHAECTKEYTANGIYAIARHRNAIIRKVWTKIAEIQIVDILMSTFCIIIIMYVMLNLRYVIIDKIISNITQFNAR